ncbi:hypothetical protein [Hydrogenophaga sp. OTU3427]|uniref:hypothetical protein n=1 Tax=Hydrogenophaga sp. OTU3427 TaxID=3043856 RepID=UPI00313B5FE7
MPIDRSNYPGVPDDFPVDATLSALSGAQPKMSLIEENGKLYAPGTSPSEVLTAFQVCEDLVSQMAAYCQRKLPTFDGNKEATVRAAFQGLLSKQWCSPAQSAWIMRNTVYQLGWTLINDLHSDPDLSQNLRQ